MVIDFKAPLPNACGDLQETITRDIRTLEKRDTFVSWLRLATIASGIAAALLGWTGWGHAFWFLTIICLVVFVILLSLHEKIFYSLRTQQRRLVFIHRSNRRFSKGSDPEGPEGLNLVPKEHPAAFDLNLFGKGSLFSSLCVAKTRQGYRMLADWLLEPSPVHEILARAEAVKELKGEIDLRLRRIGLYPDTANGIDLESTVLWGESKLPDLSPMTIGIAISLASFNLCSFVLWAGYGAPVSFFLLGILLTGIVYAIHFSKLQQVLGPVRRQSETLRLFSSNLRLISEREWVSPFLRQLRERAGNRSEKFILALANIINRWQARMNQLIAPLAFLVLWDFFFARLIIFWQRQHGGCIRDWIHAVAQFEALDSLAHQAFLFTDTCFPDISDSPFPFIQGKNLAHPLIPRERCVKNDVELSPPVRFQLISGSNMSGKSTYMRTVGINTALALAGGAVHADQMRLTPLRIVATLQIQDSLNEGLSKFGAELARLRQVVQLSHAHPPLLFLLDEIFSGTNSRDRLAGAKGLISDLISRSAIGMITTHDLALADIPGEMGSEGVNGHFAERMDNGVMIFDYKLRPGVVVGSNARGLMRAIGIQIAEPET